MANLNPWWGLDWAEEFQGQKAHEHLPTNLGYGEDPHLERLGRYSYHYFGNQTNADVKPLASFFLDDDVNDHHDAGDVNDDTAGGSPVSENGSSAQRKRKHVDEWLGPGSTERALADLAFFVWKPSVSSSEKAKTSPEDTRPPPPSSLAAAAVEKEDVGFETWALLEERKLGTPFSTPMGGETCRVGGGEKCVEEEDPDNNIRKTKEQDLLDLLEMSPERRLYLKGVLEFLKPLDGDGPDKGKRFSARCLGNGGSISRQFAADLIAFFPPKTKMMELGIAFGTTSVLLLAAYETVHLVDNFMGNFGTFRTALRKAKRGLLRQLGQEEEDGGGRKPPPLTRINWGTPHEHWMDLYHDSWTDKFGPLHNLDVDVVFIDADHLYRFVLQSGPEQSVSF